MLTFAAVPPLNYGYIIMFFIVGEKLYFYHCEAKRSRQVKSKCREKYLHILALNVRCEKGKMFRLVALFFRQTSLALLENLWFWV